MSLDVEGIKADAINVRKKLTSERQKELQEIKAELMDENNVKALREAAYCYYAHYLLAEQRYE